MKNVTPEQEEVVEITDDNEEE